MAQGKKNHQAKIAAQRRKRTVLGVGGIAIVFVVGFLIVNGFGGNDSAFAAPAWVATTTDGEDLGSDALKGEVYALDFFFLTCGICEIQLPENRKMVEALADRDDFTFISVTADPSDTKPLIEKHRQEVNATWPHVRDVTGLYSRFEVRGNPNIVFVDRDGNIALTVMELAKGEYLLEQALRILDGEAPSEPGPGQTQDASH